MIDSEDTDVYVQAEYVSHHTPGLLCIKKKHQVMLFLSICNEELAEVIIPLHVLTGCDSNSGFYGHDKKIIYEQIAGNKELLCLLQKFWGKFTCHRCCGLRQGPVCHPIYLL